MNGRLPEREWHDRIERLQEMLRRQGMDAFLVTQNIGLYYFTGSMQAGYAWIPAEGEATFYVRRSVDRASRESVIRVVPIGSFKHFRETIARDYGEISGSGRTEQLRIATELDVLPAQIYLKLSEVLNADDNDIAIIDGSSLVRTVRMIKSPYEIGRIEAAADAAAQALELALDDLKEGVTELEWMARLEREIRLRGHIGLMRMRGYNQSVITGMVGSGAAAAEPTYFDGPAGGRGLSASVPQSVSRKVIVRDEPILIDIGCCIDGYVIDQTRTAVIGRLDDDLEEAYAVSERIIRSAEASMRPGAICEAIYSDALANAAQAGLSNHFMGYGADQVKFLGHGIGLEIDEWPVLAKGFKTPLEAGMVLAVEPKFTFPGRGVVGIENSYVITENGPRALTRSPEGIIRLN
ncbi:M24 family metallopeptidase [Paenibacillus tarimensis]